MNAMERYEEVMRKNRAIADSLQEIDMNIRLNDQKSIPPVIPAFLKKDTEQSLHEFGEAMFKKGEQTGELKERVRIIKVLNYVEGIWDVETCNVIRSAILGVE